MHVMCISKRAKQEIMLWCVCNDFVQKINLAFRPGLLNHIMSYLLVYDTTPNKSLTCHIHFEVFFPSCISREIQMQVVFMVAEKPSLAESIAKLLARGHVASRRGFNGACSIHEWSGTFMGDQVRFKMTSVCGHVMTSDFDGRYNNWDRVDPAELFVAPIEKKEANPKLKMVDFLRQEGKNAGSIILWLDCDKEGENICFEVLDQVLPVMISPKRIFRAHFSAVTDQEIHGAMRDLRSPNKNEALSVDARQELDLRIGCAFTRFQTKFFQGKYGDLNSNLVSYGPCQTPTLGFCVKRHDRIQSFKPESFWRIKVNLAAIDGGSPLELLWNRDRLFDREAAMVFLNRVKDCTSAEVLQVTRKEKVKPRPQGLNTVEMLRVASSALGIGPHTAMAVAERLYTSGYINYPRTESTAYPETFDLRALVQHQTGHPSWGDIARGLLKTGLTPPRKGHNAGDHPPIAPMRLASPGELAGEASRLYSYIAQHFLATVMPDCRYESTQVLVSIGEDELFTVTGTKVIDPGYTELLTWQAVEEKTLPESALVRGARLTLAGEPTLVEGQTGPPDYLTEAELITAMERHGIGTDASIPTHIENIVQRAYVQLISGRRLQPTALGIVLVHGYQTIDPELVLPHMRRAVEEQLNYIARGQAQFDQVLQFVTSIFSAKYRYFVERISAMDQLFEVSFSSLADTGKPLSRCGKCHRYLKLIDSRPQRLHCPTCSETYTVPQNGTIRNYKEVKCPLDDFQLLMWSQGTKSKGMVFCPYCYSHPPFENMLKASGCDRCPHPTCPQSMHTRSVDACPECPNGILILDDSCAPKYRFYCNRCPTIILVSEAIKHITVGTTACATCSAMHLNVKIDPSKLSTPAGCEGAEEIGGSFSGCVFCSTVLCHSFDVVHSRQSNTHSSAMQRGPSRGSRGSANHGGRGPRGRGRRL
ncbi:DNA topoisomerase [Fasciola hepatica]|uniref:DNA topoisomerase n=1 Tax=Fasciola hepatica TaxID=6192 RepID=A0A4E0QWM0_FASHE|nr:DNA topoisomerase [Fasciola hepatica]